MTKRKHTDFLDEYINGYLLDKRGQSETARGVKAAAIKGLYRVNNSLLFGHFSLTKQAPVAPDKPLLAEDIRQVLKTLPAHARAPLLYVWQGGIGINRVLSMRWKDVEEGLQRGENPLRVEFFGRKRHRRPYHTYFGRDAIEHLRVIRGRWREFHGREPAGEDLIFTGKTKLHVTQQQYDHLNMQFRRVAMGLHERGPGQERAPGELAHAQPQALVQDGGGPRRRQVGDLRVPPWPHRRDSLRLQSQGRGAPRRPCGGVPQDRAARLAGLQRDGGQAGRPEEREGYDELDRGPAEAGRRDEDGELSTSFLRRSRSSSIRVRADFGTVTSSSSSSGFSSEDDDDDCIPLQSRLPSWRI